ncbi:MAG: hypothetical protein HQ539_02680 [Parcubacteria group bacterium]|nr:hypothetical protein [Parcubacteria group bacterium]
MSEDVAKMIYAFRKLVDGISSGQIDMPEGNAYDDLIAIKNAINRLEGSEEEMIKVLSAAS